MKIEGHVQLLIALAWMEGFREGAEAAGGDHEEAYRRAGGANRLKPAVDDVMEYAEDADD